MKIFYRMMNYFFILVFFLISPLSIARDLDAIKKEGILRVIKFSGLNDYLPRVGIPSDFESVYISKFAHLNNLAIEEIYVDSIDQCFKELKSKGGDIIVSNIVVTEARKQKAAFTQPLFSIDEFLVSAHAAKISLANDLYGKTIHVFKGSHHETTAKELTKYIKDLQIDYLPLSTTMDQVYTDLVKGEYDYIIQDSNKLDSDLKYRNDIKKYYQVSGDNKVAWAVRKKSAQLLKALNDFIKQKTVAKNQVATSDPGTWVRFGIMNGIYSYYIYRGDLRGFQYELLKKFISDYHLKYTLVIVDNQYQMMDMLKEGEIDVAVGFFSEDNAFFNDIVLTQPFHHASEVVVTRSGDKSLNTLDDMSGRFITVSKTSKHRQSLEKLSRQYPKIKTLLVPEAISVVSLVQGVDQGIYDMTIADSHIVDIEKVFSEGIATPLIVSDNIPHGWLVRNQNKILLEQINRFFKDNYKSKFFNVIYNKYFKNFNRIKKQKANSELQAAEGILSPYDDAVKKHAVDFKFDWKLLVAQMHQESRFNPDAKSDMGAFGLFQVLPKTAHQLGYKEFISPENNIRAGVHYMSWLRKQIKKDKVFEEDVIWFVLASYNAGLGHVRDAIILARKKGWKTDRWFDEVEKALLLLSNKKYAAKARFGYVRGRETVNYVQAIKERYEAYKSNTDMLEDMATEASVTDD